MCRSGATVLFCPSSASPPPLPELPGTDTILGAWHVIFLFSFSRFFQCATSMSFNRIIDSQSNAASAMTSTPAASLPGACDGVYEIQAGAPIPNQGPPTAASIWALFSLATCFLALRVYSKLARGRRLWWDDWVLLVSWVGSLIYSRIIQPSARGG